MAVIKPFKAVRPKKGLENKIAALPYDVYNRAEAKEKVKGNPLSFLNIDRAETQFSDDVDTYDDRVYLKAKELFDTMLDNGEFIEDDKPCYYLYELTMNGRAQTGIVACASVDDYVNGVIKKHENTRAEKEADRIRHVDTLSAQTGPIFLAYKNDSTINGIVLKIKESAPLYDFTADDNISHRVWVISGAKDTDAVYNAFSNINSIYIADGHHRCASAVKVSLKRREKAYNETGRYDSAAEYNYFLSVLFPDDQLMIMDYNRVIKDISGLSDDEILSKISEISKDGVHEVDLCKPDSQCNDKCTLDLCKPKRKGQVALYIGGKWYSFDFSDSIKSNDPVKGLDVSLLQDYVIDAIFGIKDPKTDNRIDFVGGIRGLEELVRRCETDCKAAFAMYPTSIQELFNVADASLLMPPKSTWFEPKLRSGLFIHRI